MLYVAFRDTLLRSRPGGDLRLGKDLKHAGGVLNRLPQKHIAVAAIHLAGRGEFEAAAEQPGADLAAHRNDHEDMGLMSGGEHSRLSMVVEERRECRNGCGGWQDEARRRTRGAGGVLTAAARVLTGTAEALAGTAGALAGELGAVGRPRQGC